MIKTDHTVLRIGVVGLGRAATYFLPSLAKHPNIKITAGADPRTEALTKFAQEFGAEVYQSAEDLCKSENVDAVYIATPHHLHVENVVCAAMNGKHVIVEKPMALTLEECDQMIDAAKKTGIKLMVGPTHGFDSPILKIREMVRSGDFGKVKMINTWNYKNFVYIPLRTDELDANKGGGAVFNQAPHQIDIVRWIGGGRVRSVRAATSMHDEQRPVEGAYTVFLEFENGIAASMIFNGYGRFDTDEFNDWVGEGGMLKKQGEFVAAKKRLKNLSPEEEEALKALTGYGGSMAREPNLNTDHVDRFHPHFGITLVSCERADLRTSARGVFTYDDEEIREIAVSIGAETKINAVNELYESVVNGRIPIHDGAWGKANVEICLAILKSAKERSEVYLSHQVPTPDEIISS